MTKSNMTEPNYNPNGVLLHEGKNIAVIATGLETESTNDKTGAMIQIWILHRHMSPWAAVRTGRDKDICGNCSLRGRRKLVGPRYKVVDRKCYVEIGKAATGIYKCMRRGRYRMATPDEYQELFGGRIVRFGAYGDPAMIPADIVAAIARVCSQKRTGYTHQWENAPAMAAYCMASVESKSAAAIAQANGYRTFRMRPFGDTEPLMENEIVCPASTEGGKRTTCDKCSLCDGKRGSDDRRKNIAIIDHSAVTLASARKLIQISLQYKLIQ